MKWFMKDVKIFLFIVILVFLFFILFQYIAYAVGGPGVVKIAKPGKVYNLIIKERN